MRNFIDYIMAWAGVVMLVLAYVFIIMNAPRLFESEDATEWSVDTNCPQEDSCYPDYRDGEWYIVEGSR